MKWTPTAADDFDAAVWTFFAFVANARGFAPWRGGFLSNADDELTARKDWVLVNATLLDEELRDYTNDAATRARQVAALARTA